MTMLYDCGITSVEYFKALLLTWVEFVHVGKVNIVYTIESSKHIHFTIIYNCNRKKININYHNNSEPQ